MITLFLIVFLTLTISGICSLFEAILYSTRIGTLEVAKSKGDKKGIASQFLKMKKNISAPISAILILNTIANTAGATLAGMYAAKVFGGSNVLLFSIVLTLGILFFSEIIPKTIGAVHWRRFWFYIVRPLAFIKLILHPLVFITQKLSSFITTGQKHVTITEEEILAAAQMGAREGEISDQEHAIIDNLIHLENKTVREIMTPRTVIFSLDGNLTVPDALKLASAKGFTRVPIYEEDKENIIGYIRIHDLTAARNLEDPKLQLKKIARSISIIPEMINCFNLLTDFLRHRKHIGIVVDEYGGLAGVVTLEDLLETILGHEIVDEHDYAIDLQEVARKRRGRLKLDQNIVNKRNEK